MQVENWGLISYPVALAQQLERVEGVSTGTQPETLIVCTHPPVVTIGRGTKPGDVFGWIGETVEISRGGRATYHGPSQLVVYPILDLNRKHNEMPARDLHAYMRVLEESLILTLREFGVSAERRVAKAADEGLSYTGVWAEHEGRLKKLASIGIGVKKWISYHGLALNVAHDPMAHVGINPCGFQAEVMTSMEEVLGQSVAHADVERVLISALLSQFT